MNNSNVTIKPIQLEKQYAIDALQAADFGENWLVTANRALALQTAAQQYEYVAITAAQARELGAGNAMYQLEDIWIPCGGVHYKEFWPFGVPIKYRAIKQAQPETIIKHFGTIHEENGKLMFTDFSVDGCGTTDDSQTATAKAVIKRIEASLKQAQPEPVDPHADNFAADPHPAYRAMYDKQVAEGTTGFYLWELMTTTNPDVWQQKTTGDEPHWTATTQYRCTDISCHVSKDGEPAVRMLRTEARELQAALGDTVEWWAGTTKAFNDEDFTFNLRDTTYTYRTKATIKLDGKMVTREQAVAEWEVKKETHEMWFQFGKLSWTDVIGFPTNLIDYFIISNDCEYELRPKELNIVSWGDVPQFVKVQHKTTKQTFAFLGVDTFGYLAVFRRDCDDYSYNPPALELAPANEQPWIYWGGGECPVPDGCTFEVVCRSGNVRSQKEVTDWTHTEHAGDIIAYRITGIAKGYVLESAV